MLAKKNKSSFFFTCLCLLNRAHRFESVCDWDCCGCECQCRPQSHVHQTLVSISVLCICNIIFPCSVYYDTMTKCFFLYTMAAMKCRPQTRSFLLCKCLFCSCVLASNRRHCFCWYTLIRINNYPVCVCVQKIEFRAFDNNCSSFLASWKQQISTHGLTARSIE